MNNLIKWWDFSMIMFHLPTWEMTITLDDVFGIYRLFIDNIEILTEQMLDKGVMFHIFSVDWRCIPIGVGGIMYETYHS